MLRSFIATLLVVALPMMPAFAAKPDKSDKPGKSKGNSNAEKSQGGGNQGHGSDHDSNDDGDDRRFSSQDRDYWHDYWGDHYGRGNCPPGLAKKNNGCLPPGQAKKRYAIGHPLPRDIVIIDVPAVLLPRLVPLPPGYRYGIVDGDLVQLAIGSLLVIDALDGLLD